MTLARIKHENIGGLRQHIALDANANAVAIQHIKLENEGWIRDTSVQEQPEPSFQDPAS